MFADKEPPQQPTEETEEESEIGEEYILLVDKSVRIEGLRSSLPRDRFLAHRQFDQPEEQETKARVAHHKRQSKLFFFRKNSAFVLLS